MQVLNYIVGSHIVVVYTKLRSQQEHEFASNRCILAALYPDGWREGCGKHIRDMLAPWQLARRESLPYVACVSYRFGCAEKNHVMEENFRLDLNQSWEAIDIRTGHAVLIPKGSHQAIRMLLNGPRDQTDENYLVVMVQHEGHSVLAGLREAYWRQWEGHYIREFRVKIREMKEKPHPPPSKRP